MREQGIYDAVRRFLLDVILRDAVTPDEWGGLGPTCAPSRRREDVRADAMGFWEWLFDGEPLPATRAPRGPLGPPQT